MMQPIQSRCLTHGIGIRLVPDCCLSLSQLLQNILMLLGGLVMCYYTSYQLSMLAFVT